MTKSDNDKNQNKCFIHKIKKDKNIFFFILYRVIWGDMVWSLLKKD
jgi:hypothetical protein